MADETVLHIVGTLTADPEMQFIPSGAGVVNFTVASNRRLYNKQTDQWEDGEALFLRCKAWRDLAEHIIESLSKGDRVLVSGRLRQHNWEKNGQKHTTIELEVDEIGPSLKWATAKPVKVKSSNGSSSRQSASVSSSGTSAGGFDDEPPF